MIGDIIKNQSVLSAYNPSDDVINFTILMKRDYTEGVRILTKPWTELNDRSVINDENNGQKMFNAYVDESEEDPFEAWKWKGTRSKARNKGIAMMANLTASYLLPLFIAQNENDEEDQDFSEVMRDLIEWMAQPTNSNYQSSFLQIVFGMMTNPVTYMGAEFAEIYHTIKEKEGNFYKRIQVLDKVLSGFKCPVWSSSQVLITNPYERNIQKQRAIIQRRYCEYDELKAKYKDHPNWGFVQRGIKSVYNDDDGLFYDIKDDDHPNLCAEEIYKKRRGDIEVPMVNGIYMGDSNVDDNPIKHRDNNNNPKYNIIPFGFSRIGNHFFYYKSMMNALRWENRLYDAMSEIVMNRALLDVDMPIAVSGTDKIDSEVIFPKSVVVFEDKDTKISPLLPNSNLSSGFAVLESLKDSIDEGSINDTTAGQLPEASQKAYSVAQATANAKKIIGVVGKSLAESVVQYGDLMKDIAINHLTTAEVDELVGEGLKLKYKTFFLSENESSSNISKLLKFDESLIGREMTQKEIEEKNIQELEKLSKKRGKKYNELKESFRLINPVVFARFNYLTKVDIQEMFTKNQEYWQPLLTNLEAQLRNNPFIDQEKLLRKLLYSYFQSEGDELIKKQEMAGILPAVKGRANQFANQVNNQMTANAVENKIL